MTQNTIYFVLCRKKNIKWTHVLYCNKQILRVMPFKIQLSSGFKYQFDRQQISLKFGKF